MGLSSLCEMWWEVMEASRLRAYSQGLHIPFREELLTTLALKLHRGNYNSLTCILDSLL